jgi:hypothetical protein
MLHTVPSTYIPYLARGPHGMAGHVDTSIDRNPLSVTCHAVPCHAALRSQRSVLQAIIHPSFMRVSYPLDHFDIRTLATQPLGRGSRARVRGNKGVAEKDFDRQTPRRPGRFHLACFVPAQVPILAESSRVESSRRRSSLPVSSFLLAFDVPKGRGSPSTAKKDGRIQRQQRRRRQHSSPPTPIPIPRPRPRPRPCLSPVPPLSTHFFPHHFISTSSSR